VSVVIQFQSQRADGSEGTYFSVTLANAAVLSFRQYIGAAPADTVSIDELEIVEFTFQQIDITFTDGGITATDTWDA
jgi:type VI secretion system Hcp family effector